MKPKRLVPLVVAAACAVVAAPAAAATVQRASSQNWSGYVVDSSSRQSFSSVSGSWVQPSAKCSTASGHAAFWVGLGGSGHTQALEQAGTEADCSSSGKPTYFAWYELVPSAPVHLALTISAGDHISSSVSVSGHSVQIALTDTTTGQSVAKTLSMTKTDTSSAEWIAEAPSACDASLSNCQPLALTDFGSVSFTSARATTTDGHTGTISDSAWSASSVSLNSTAANGDIAYSSSGSSGGATPTSLTSDGGSFSVAYSAGTVTTQSGAGVSPVPNGAGTGGAGAYPAGAGAYPGGSGGSGYPPAPSYGAPGEYGYLPPGYGGY